MAKSFYASTCTTTGKRGYFTKALAKRAMRDSHHHDVSVYRCDQCCLFHIGGWHGSKDRSAHRGVIDKPTMTLIDASKHLHVSTVFIARLIEEGKVRHNNGEPYRSDIERIATQ